MSGVYIKGMEMPKRCGECPLSLYPHSPCWENGGALDWENRPNWCPLVFVPPHGRLIDGTDLYALLDGGYDVDLDALPETKDALLSMIQSAETIIPAEEATQKDGGQDEAPTGPYDLLYEEGGAGTT